METLIAVVMMWVSANFDLAASSERPRVVFAPAAKIVALRYGGLAVPPSEIAAASQGQRPTVAVYEAPTRTIYLPEGWSPNSAADVSVLVHEVVHHLQTVGGVKFDCPQQREKLAYQAQNRWLEQFGRDLARAFEVDPFTVLVASSCGF